MYQWNKIKVIGNYDTVVVGGGTAGAAAGIRAAKEGNKVLIVEKSLALGGAAVNALVNPMMESFVEHGEIFHEIERRLKEKGVTTRDGVGICTFYGRGKSTCVRGDVSGIWRRDLI